MAESSDRPISSLSLHEVAIDAAVERCVAAQQRFIERQDAFLSRLEEVSFQSLNVAVAERDSNPDSSDIVAGFSRAMAVGVVAHPATVPYDHSTIGLVDDADGTYRYPGLIRFPTTVRRSERLRGKEGKFLPLTDSTIDGANESARQWPVQPAPQPTFGLRQNADNETKENATSGIAASGVFETSATRLSKVVTT